MRVGPIAAGIRLFAGPFPSRQLHERAKWQRRPEALHISAAGLAQFRARARTLQPHHFARFGADRHVFVPQKNGERPKLSSLFASFRSNVATDSQCSALATATMTESPRPAIGSGQMSSTRFH